MLTKPTEYINSIEAHHIIETHVDLLSVGLLLPVAITTPYCAAFTVFSCAAFSKKVVEPPIAGAIIFCLIHISHNGSHLS